jgi:uncharacterized protein YndB with AHSA1/START domain
MSTKKQTTIEKDLPNRKLVVVREFDAPLEEVWKAWTEKEILDQWWAPKPWKAETKSMDFREGGTWLYSMVGPDGTRSYCRADYTTIIPNKTFIGNDAFCDENGNVTNDPPPMRWKADFSPAGTGTKVVIEISFASEADLETIVKMGFNEGFTAAHGNLDELLAQKINA